jgi:predicted transcriptional regulator
MLSPKHLNSHGLDAKEYRKKYGFSARQPLCVKALSEKRSASGKERGISANLKKAIVARTKKRTAAVESE